MSKKKNRYYSPREMESFLDGDVVTVDVNNLFGSNDISLEELQEEVQEETELEEKEFESIPNFGKVANCKRVNVRKFPNTNSEVLDILVVGEEVEILGKSAEEWYQVSINNRTNGFIMERYIDAVWEN